MDAAPKCATAKGAPVPRGDSAAALDASGKLTLLFGGDTGNAPCAGSPSHVHVGDTWVFDRSCSVWIPIEGGANPSTRSRHVLVSDVAHNRAILFGGRRREAASGPYTALNDTWAFDFKAQAHRTASGRWAMRGYPGEVKFNTVHVREYAELSPRLSATLSAVYKDSVKALRGMSMRTLRRKYC